MRLTPPQQAAADAATRTLSARRPFLLIGPAGTGKTTAAVSIIADLLAKGLRVAATAPTHAAARILARKLQSADLDLPFCGTIHALAGLSPSSDDAVRRLRRTGENKATDFDVIVLDEASMVGRDLQAEIDALAPPAVLYLGDAAQLPPVMESEAPIFSRDISRAELREIVRQGKGNPIIGAATAIRAQMPDGDLDFAWATPAHDGERGIFCPDGAEALALLQKAFKPYWLLEPDAARVLAFTNRRVAQYNRLIRTWLYGETETPFVPDERIVCRRPVVRWQSSASGRWHAVTLFGTLEEANVARIERGTEAFDFPPLAAERRERGEQWQALDGWEISMPVWRVWLDHEALGPVPTLVPVDPGHIKQIDARLIAEARLNRRRWGHRYGFLEKIADLRAPYAMTVHCSQGATFGRVFVDFADLAAAKGAVLFRQRLAYTAMTRAAEAALLLHREALADSPLAEALIAQAITPGDDAEPLDLDALPPLPAREAQADDGTRALLDALRRRPAALSPWERDFVASLAERRGVSPKQAAVVRRIAAERLGTAYVTNKQRYY